MLLSGTRRCQVGEVVNGIHISTGPKILAPNMAVIGHVGTLQVRYCARRGRIGGPVAAV